MKKFLKFRCGEKGFTLIELLIVVAILGILAVVIVPNLAGFLGTGKVAAANTEVANVETAALAYYADNDGTWPTSAWSDLYNATTPALSYLSDQPKDDYGFDVLWGKVTPDATAGWGTDATIVWNIDAHKWEKD